MDVLTPEQRRRCMQSNKSRGTKPELAMARLLWRNGIRYRKHPRDVAGRPDFCIKKYKLAIFVDGEFWHGRDWERKKARIKGNKEFWVAKIERNRRRDVRVTTELTAKGWKVLRFWESDIKRNPGRCLSEVISYIAERCGFDPPAYIQPDFADADDQLAAESSAPYE